jgi:hypothetical protein
MSTVQSQFSFASVTSAINAAIAAATPADGSISLAKLATQATATILGNNSGSNASPSALSASNARTVLGLATTDSPTFAGGTFTGSLLASGAFSTSSPPLRFGTGCGIQNIGTSSVEVIAAGNRALSISSGITIPSWGSITFLSGNIGSGTGDLVLHRGGPGILEQRNGTNGQIARWFKTYTSATNGEWAEIDAAGDASNFDIAACIGSAGGTARGIRIGGKSAAGVFTSWLSFGTTGAATFSGTVNARASTTVAGTAPIKIATGVLMTTPEAGAIEYDGTNLYFTDSGGTRRTLAVV